MHKIDELILKGKLTRAALKQAASEPLPPQGESYWADEMRVTKNAIRAAQRAARMMGASLASIASATR